MSQVHKFLTKNHDQLRPEVFDLFIQSRHKMVFSLFKKAKEKYNQQKTIVSRGKGHRANAVTLASRFQQSLQELTAKLERCNTFFIHCIKPNPKKLPGIFDVDYVTGQLRHSGIFEAIQIRKEGYPIRTLCQNFVNRYGILGNRSQTHLPLRDQCAAIIEKFEGNHSDLYQIGLTKVFMKDNLFQLLENQWTKTQKWAVLTIQKNIRGFITRKNFRFFRKKVIVIQAHIRGHQTRKRYKRLKKSLEQFWAMVLISKSVVQRKLLQWLCTDFGSFRSKSTLVGKLENMDLSGVELRRAKNLVQLRMPMHQPRQTTKKRKKSLEKSTEQQHGEQKGISWL
nr:PREDICTED: unconventional myosin-XV-like [Latimeria chalumnae]|eukprot:XP_014347315.1 PREDICTED: unconventional myosin-XV-like [Latimeria chalumnae]